MALDAAGDVHFDDGGDQALADSNDDGGIAVVSSAHDNIAPHRENGVCIQACLELDVDLPAELSLLSTLDPADDAAADYR